MLFPGFFIFDSMTRFPEKRKVEGVKKDYNKGKMDLFISNYLF
jgi:hypothetical protein